MRKDLFVDAAKAEDLSDLLNHIAWTDVLRPALMREREMYTKLLVASTLGAPVEVATHSGTATLTKEQLAGKIYGIDYILNLMETVIKKGARAVEELSRAGVHITSPNGSSSNSTNSSI
jgi:hypothetical protein